VVKKRISLGQDLRGGGGSHIMVGEQGWNSGKKNRRFKKEGGGKNRIIYP